MIYHDSFVHICGCWFNNGKHVKTFDTSNLGSSLWVSYQWSFIETTLIWVNYLMGNFRGPPNPVPTPLRNSQLAEGNHRDPWLKASHWGEIVKNPKNPELETGQNLKTTVPRKKKNGASFFSALFHQKKWTRFILGKLHVKNESVFRVGGFNAQTEKFEICIYI